MKSSSPEAGIQRRMTWDKGFHDTVRQSNSRLKRKNGFDLTAFLPLWDARDDRGETLGYRA